MAHLSFPNLLALLALCLCSKAASVIYTGYIVDNYCWDKPGHVGIDGAKLETAPETHILHCLVWTPCKPGGYALLEPYDSSTGDKLYRIKYQLHTESNAKAITFFEEELASERGDRMFEMVTVSGSVSTNKNGVDTIQMDTIALASTANNSTADTEDGPANNNTADSGKDLVSGAASTSGFLGFSAMQVAIILVMVRLTNYIFH